MQLLLSPCAEVWDKSPDRAARPQPRPKPMVMQTCIVCGVRFVEYGDLAHPRSRICDKLECALELTRCEAEPLVLMCRCLQRLYAHEITIHAQTRPESYDPKLRVRY